MPYKINDQEFAAVLALPPPRRYTHFVKRVADWQEVWMLSSDQGFVVAADDGGRQLMPAWPHPRYAAACATGHWESAEPELIPLEAWMERWLPGMERDGLGVAVFPTPETRGVVVEPVRLLSDLTEELQQYE